MKIWMIMTAIPLALSLTMLAVGLALPATRAATASRQIAASQERLIFLLLDVEAQPSWRRDIVSVERTPDGWIESNNRGEMITFQRRGSAANTIHVTFTSNRGYFGKWTGVLKPDGTDRTWFTVTEEATTPSPVGRLLSRAFFDPKAFSNAYLDDLQHAAERQPGIETEK